MIEDLIGPQHETVVQQLGQQFGLSPSQASSAVSALLPALAAGFQQNASTPTGLGSLLGALGSGRHQQYVEDPATLTRPQTVTEGTGILGHLFGSKEVSREVAQRASAQSGVSPDVLKQMLPIVAALVMGALAKRHATGASTDVGMQNLPGGIPGGMPGATGGGVLDVLAPMLDRNRDGSMVDDVIGMIGRFMGGR